jgi:hypothetical protein
LTIIIITEGTGEKFSKEMKKKNKNYFILQMEMSHKIIFARGNNENI